MHVAQTLYAYYWTWPLDGASVGAAATWGGHFFYLFVRHTFPALQLRERRLRDRGIFHCEERTNCTKGNLLRIRILPPTLSPL
jgi:hypothetical protein